MPESSGTDEPVQPDYTQPEPVENWHRCHFCGTEINNGVEVGGRRHWLSDCRPDLVEHEEGELCTAPETPELMEISGYQPWCYAYQDRYTGVWTSDHVHFYTDGPM